MSGGLWNYRDATETIPLEKMGEIVEALRSCWHEIDWAESDDTTREEGARKIYNILLELGDSIWESTHSHRSGPVPERPVPVRNNVVLCDEDGGRMTWREVWETWYPKKEGP